MTPEILEFLKDVDIIHAHFAALPTDFAMLVSRRLGIPFIFTVHAYDIFVHTTATKLAEYATAAARIITVSEFNRKFMLDMIGDKYREKIDIIRCGIDLNRFSPQERPAADKVTVLTAGRFVEKKGILYSIRAMAKMPENCALRIIGDGPLRKEIEQLIAELHIQHRVTLLGALSQSEVIREMQQSDIFILPSITATNKDREGLPVAILEAQAMKLPVVSTFHTGIPEGVVNGQTGLLVKEKDIEALTDSLLLLSKDRDLRIRMGDEGRRHIYRSFNMSNEIIKLEKILAECAQLKPALNLAEISDTALCNLTNRDNRLKILFISHDPRLYGAQRSLLDLILGLNKDLFKPIVLSSREGLLTEILGKNDIEALIFPFEWWIGANFKRFIYRVIKLIQHLKVIKDKIKLIKPDLIYTNTAVIPIGGILSIILEIPHIWHVREFVQQDIGVNYDFGNFLSMKFMSLSSRKIICNSEAIKQNLSRYIPKKKLIVVYNGILDLANQPQLPKTFPSDKIYNLCIVGSVGSHKGQSDAIHAMRLLKEKGIKVILQIYGNGPLAEIQKLKELVARLNLSEDVIFHGFKNDINSVFLNSDITVVCSRHEAFGRVAVESMALGTPVIGTNTGGFPEIVEDGETGLLYSPGDVQDLAEKIQMLLTSPSSYNLFSREGQLRVYKRFNKQRYIADLEKIIREITHKNQ